jgi:hypothetical protein
MIVARVTDAANNQIVDYDHTKVNRMTVSLYGGLSFAEVELDPMFPEEEFLSWVGKFCELADLDDGERWVGLVTGVKVPYGFSSLVSSYDNLYNSVKVITSMGAEFVETDWVEDEESIRAFGKKQRILSLSDLTETEAQNIATKYLEEHRNPFVGLDLVGMRSEKVVLTITGLYQTLDWVYYRNPLGLEGYSELGSGGREIGEDDRPKIAQQIQLSTTTGWDAGKIRIRPWKYPEDNPPTDNLVIKLHSDSSGQPGVVLAQVSIPASEIETSSDWLEKPLPSLVALNPGTTYWISVERSGSVDKTKYFMVDTNLDMGYPRGEPYLWYTSKSAWVLSPQKGDLNFELVGLQSVQAFIEDVVSQCGQFLQGTIFRNNFPETIEMFRKGENTALYEIKNALKVISNLANAWVDANKKLVVEVIDTEVSSIEDYCFLDENGMTRFKNDLFRKPKFAPYLLQKSIFQKVFFPSEIEYDTTGKFRISRTMGSEQLFGIGEIF